MRRYLARPSSKPPEPGLDSAVRGNSLTVASPLNSSRWAAPAVAALLITACGGGSASNPQPAKGTTTATAKAKPKPAPKRPPNDTQLLTQLLEKRASALRTADAGSFLATSTGEQAAKDKTAIKRVASLPLHGVQMTTRAIDVDGDRATMRVDMVYAFGAVDSRY